MNRARRRFLTGVMVAWLLVAVTWISLGILSSSSVKQTRSYSAYASEQAGFQNEYAEVTSAAPVPDLPPKREFDIPSKKEVKHFHISSKVSKKQKSSATAQQPNEVPKVQENQKSSTSTEANVVPEVPEVSFQALPQAQEQAQAQINVPEVPRVLNHGYEYPDWFLSSWPRTAVFGLEKEFVGDKPLFPQCKSKIKTKGFPFEKPRDYIPTSKNPCWYENPEEKKGLRCAPYFYLAGVAKGGTTDMYKRLRLHPDIMEGTMKEYHFWDRDRYEHLSKEDRPVGDVQIKGGVPFRVYLDRVTGEGLEEVEADLKSKGTSEKIFGDGSPSYLWDSFYWIVLDGNQGCKEPRMLTGQHIRHFYPDAKIILSFRHPTPRLYSRFLSRIPRKNELKKATSLDFHRFVVHAIEVYRACFEKWSIRQCVYNHTAYQDAFVRIASGFYPVFMEDWLRIWPRNQILIVRYEDYGRDLKGVLKQMFDFLEVAPLTEEQWANVTAVERANEGTDQYQTVGKMLPETKAILDEFYEPFIHKFAEMLNDERFLWNDVSH